jgi:hypothetical protein
LLKHRFRRLYERCIGLFFRGGEGEHLALPVNPVKLYEKTLHILLEQGISYIEIINDAADTFGIECIMQAGFTPCAYLPAFKLQGSTRRDYVIFGKSFEYLCRPDLNAHPAYIDFYREYFRIEGKNYFPDLGSIASRPVKRS